MRPGSETTKPMSIPDLVSFGVMALLPSLLRG